MFIKSLSFRNFKSYGNNLTKIVFGNKGSLNSIVSQNGGGKSSIINALTYGLYGKVQKLNLSDLPNRLNSHLEVFVELTTNNKDVIIHRGYAPSIFNLSVDGKMIDGSGKASLQTFLEEELLGIPFHIFNNIRFNFRVLNTILNKNESPNNVCTYIQQLF